MYSDPYDPELFAPLLKAYQENPISLYYERKNSGSGRSQSIGILPRRNYGVGESRNNDRYKDILNEARKLAKVICPDLNYTTIMLNQNYEAEPHRDRNNDGESCVVAFGDYEGGELKIHGVPGMDKFSLRYRSFRFHASDTTHSVESITSGTRYSIVFFRPRFPQNFVKKYGSTLTYDELYNLIPTRTPGQPASSVRIPLASPTA